MKITERSSERIVIKHCPVVGIIIGLFFVSLGSFLLFFSGSVEGIPPWWLNAVFVLSGILALLFSKFSIVVVADKNTGKISFFRKSLVSRQFEDFEISNIKEIRLKRKVKISSEGENSRRFCAYMIMNDGQAVALPGCNSPSYRKKEKTARELADFLGVPFVKDFNFSSTLIFGIIKKLINKK